MACRGGAHAAHQEAYGVDELGDGGIAGTALHGTIVDINR
jgi:hypothetical protein